MNEGVVLDYRIDRVDAGGLALSYRVVNRSGSSIYLFTPMAEISTEGIIPAPEKVYVFLDPKGVVHITKRLWHAPDDADVYMPEVPFLTQVLPGGRFEEKLSLPVPLRIAYPYRFEEGDEAKGPPEVTMASAAGLAFSIGYLLEENAGASVARVTTPRGAQLKTSYANGEARQLLLEGQPLGLEVVVQDAGR
jgi:hypothetical protein